MNEKHITPRSESSLTHSDCAGEEDGGHSGGQMEQMHCGGQHINGERVGEGNGTLSSPRQEKSTTSPRQHRSAFNVNQKDNDAPTVTSSDSRRIHTGGATGYLVPLSIRF